jgi:endonuclease YncB( thermonuclease family)
VSPTVVAGLLGALGGAALVVTAMPSDLFGRVPVLSGTVSADAPQVAVVDGSTLRLRETVIRLYGLTSPTRNQTCQVAGTAAFSCGVEATRALSALVSGHSVTCRLAGRDGSGFPEGRCDAGGTDVNRALIAAGWALARGDASDLAVDESEARSLHRGLWRDGATAPVF